MKRFDNRTKSDFEKDIMFGTKIESFLFSKFLEICENREDIFVSNPRDNGADNSGKFVEGSTFGADYKVDLKYLGKDLTNHPLEVKFVPTYGKFTLKIADLRAYIKEEASILFFYTIKTLDLKKPKDRDFDKHKLKIEENWDSIRWGIMFNDKIKEYYDKNKDRAEPIRYMGNKPGLVLNQADFGEWFVEEMV